MRDNIRHPSSVIRHPSSVIRHPSSVIRGLSFALLITSLSACSQMNSTLTNPEKSNVVPVAAAQAMVLQMELQDGVVQRSLEGFDVASVDVQDLNGIPFYHLTLMGAGVKDFWSTVDTLPEGVEYKVYGTGAIKQRDFYSFIYGRSWLESLAQTKQKAGSFKRLVSPSSGIIYLEDASGRMWNTHTVELVNNDALEKQKEQFNQLLAVREQDGTLAGLEEAWNKYLEQANAEQEVRSLQSGTPTLKELTKKDGNLDVAKLFASLETQQSNTRSFGQEKYQCNTWILWSCGEKYFADAVRKNHALPYNDTELDTPSTNTSVGVQADFRNSDPIGNQQFLGNFGMYYPRDEQGNVLGKWGVYDTVGLALTPTKSEWSITGCGPTAVMRLFNWYANQRLQYGHPSNLNFVNKNAVPPQDKSEVAKSMLKPVSIGDGLYQPEIGRYLDATKFGPGTMTNNIYLAKGINSWLQDKTNGGYEVRGNSFLLGPLGNILTSNIFTAGHAGNILFTEYTWQIANLVRTKIGKQNEPIIVLYGASSSQDPSAHYTMSQAYKVYEGWFSANVLTYITDNTYDARQGGYVNITDALAIYGGAWGVYKK